MKYIVMVLILMTNIAYGADENWLCKEMAAQRVDTWVIKTCGVAFGPNEASARMRALSNAMDELWMVLIVDTKLASKKRMVYPGRTTCDRTPHGFICRRMMKFVFESDEDE